MPVPVYDAVLCDIDGVLRHWPAVDTIEQAHGLPVGALAAAAFAPVRLHPAITGEVSDEQWRAAVAADLADACGSADRARAAVTAWGAMSIYYLKTEPAPTATEAHLAEFAEEIGLALAESRNRAELIASRARIVAVSDETRRSIERNLHDSVQQRLISLGLEVVNLKSTVPAGNGALQRQLSHIIDGLSGVGEELREISRGLHPTLLRNGLVPALRKLTRRSTIPAEFNLGTCRRLPALRGGHLLHRFRGIDQHRQTRQRLFGICLPEHGRRHRATLRLRRRSRRSQFRLRVGSDRTQRSRRVTWWENPYRKPRRQRNLAASGATPQGHAVAWLITRMFRILKQLP